MNAATRLPLCTLSELPRDSTCDGIDADHDWPIEPRHKVILVADFPVDNCEEDQTAYDQWSPRTKAATQPKNCGHEESGSVSVYSPILADHVRAFLCSFDSLTSATLLAIASSSGCHGCTLPDM